MFGRRQQSDFRVAEVATDPMVCKNEQRTHEGAGALRQLQLKGSRVMGQKQGSCCSSPKSMCYWFSVSLIAGLVFLLAGVGAFRVGPPWIWPFVLIGAGSAFLLEWRRTKDPPPGA